MTCASLRASTLVYLAWFGLLFLPSVLAYQVLVSDQDTVRQVCSGVWANNELGKGIQDPYIEILFAPASRGQLALVVFEWEDAKYLGKDPSGENKLNDWQQDRIYVCTLAARQAGLCEYSQLGKFISTSPTNTSGSIWTASVRFDPVPSAPLGEDDAKGSGPYRYEVPKTGYYCVGTVPISLEQSRYNSTYAGVVDFETNYGGHLPGSEYPKLPFFKYLSITYIALALVWFTFCWFSRKDLIQLQTYVSFLVVVLVFEHILNYRYQVYLNEYGHPGVAGAYLVLLSVIGAARNSTSLYLLCLAAMGLSIVRPSLGGALARVRLLGLCHLVFGILYSLGSSAIPVDSAAFFIIFFVIPLAFTLTAFLTWIMYSLTTTIADLGARRQTYKRTMFVRLQYILFGSIFIIFLFFVVSAVSFSSRLRSAYPSQTWKHRWLIVEGWSSILYFLGFSSIAFLWRPCKKNRKLALSEDPMAGVRDPEDEAGMYDVDALLPRGEGEEDGADELKDSYPMRRRSTSSVRETEGVMFEVGSDDEDERGGRNGKGRYEEDEDDERRRLRYSDDRQLDITTQHEDMSPTSFDAPPPEYRRSDKND
ncbi:uncharacterized protein JCM6883_007412 [Sporobolomyces salmoneus]|uniref:uncharacterized protein n=1 Tax=Sporobolomyces salmoneus TaxID=183962 RepID=UPI003175F691